jgi:catechol 2,3-dioxygenase
VLAIKTFGHEHRWGSVVEGVTTKVLHHLSFGCYAEDLPRLKARIEDHGVKLIDPPPGFESNGFWFRNHEGVLIEVKVGPKVSPDRKSQSQWMSVPAGKPGAGVRAAAPPVRPRRLSHVLIFTRDVSEAIKFYERTLGLRLSDRASDLVAFMHGIHGSDHHLLALVKSSAPGFHFGDVRSVRSWDVSGVRYGEGSALGC